MLDLIVIAICLLGCVGSVLLSKWLGERLG